MSGWTTARVVRDRDGDLWGPVGDGWGEFGDDQTASATDLERYHGPLTPVLDADRLPVVHTVGDLTARHIGRRVSIDGGPAFTLRGLLLFIRGESTDYAEIAAEWPDDDPDDEWDYTERTLDTPCEVLP